ncbi:MAG: hypothetical protein J4F28_02195 [Nitrosopumilaceae archaeon]|nr:hypothetical protein [Nitrosopumilaceae archaeon]
MSASASVPAYAYTCPWCTRNGWFGTRDEVQAHMDWHPRGKEPGDKPVPVESDPYDTGKLLQIEDVGDITSIRKYSQKSAFVLRGGEIVVGPFGHHIIMVQKVMEMAGLPYGRPEPDLDDYMEKTGVIKVDVYHTKITISGDEATPAQVRTLKDICMYAEITDPGKIDCILDDVEARELVPHD